MRKVVRKNHLGHSRLPYSFRLSLTEIYFASPSSHKQNTTIKKDQKSKMMDAYHVIELSGEMMQPPTRYRFYRRFSEHTIVANRFFLF